MKILLKNSDELEKNVQKLSVIDTEKSGERKIKQEELTTLNSHNKQNENPSNQLIAVKSSRKVNNKLILTIRKKNIFGDLVERTKKLKLDVSGIIQIPEAMRPNIVKAILPEGITFISYDAFKDCINLSEVFIPETVISISPYAFGNCRNLKDIVLPESLTELCSECFRNSGLLSIKIPKNVLKIENSAFIGCSNLRQVILQEGLKKINFNAFKDTAIEKIKIPDSVEFLGTDSLECPYIDEISLPKTFDGIRVTSICGEKRVPNIIIRGKNVVHTTDKNTTSKIRTIERTRD